MAKRAESLTLEQLRAAKYDFVLGDDARICKQLSDLQVLLLEKKIPDALSLVDNTILKTTSARRKHFRRVIEFVSAEIKRGQDSQASEIVGDLIDGIFRLSPQAIDCWGQYRRRFERLFPEVLRLRGNSAPLRIDLTAYNSLVALFMTGGKDALLFEMERHSGSEARIGILGFAPGGEVKGKGRPGNRVAEGAARGGGRGNREIRIEWSTSRAPTLNMLAHKSIHIHLPRHRACTVEFLGRDAPECRLDWDRGRWKVRTYEGWNIGRVNVGAA